MTNAYQRLWIISGLAAVLTGCKGVTEPVDDSTAPATAVSASGTAISETVGTAITRLPSVLVTDGKGRPVAGARVVFQTFGGHSTGDTTETNALGVATLASWTISTKAGDNIAFASVASLPTLKFRVIGVAGAPRAIAKLGGDNPFALPGVSVPLLPRVKVTDAFDNAVAGVLVEFRILEGQGTLEGARSQTDSLGIASLSSWTIGASGNQVVVAEAKGLPTVTFVSTPAPLTQLCQTSVELQNASSVVTDLASDCSTPDGRYYKIFRFTQFSTSAVIASVTSPTFEATELLQTLAGDPVAGGNQFDVAAGKSSFKALLPPGTYLLVVVAQHPGVTGRINVKYSVADPNDGCADTFITPGLSLAQEMANKICADKPAYVDRYRIYMAAGRSVTFRVDDKSYNGPAVELFDSGGNVAATERVEGYYTHLVEFTARANGYYTFQVTGAGQESIQYDLTVK